MPITPDDFIADAQRASNALVGYIAWDASQPDVILFSPQQFICPYVPIPKDQIEDLKYSTTYQCVGPKGAGQMWSAFVTLKQSRSEGSKTLHALLAAFSSHSGCTCSQLLDTRHHSEKQLPQVALGFTEVGPVTTRGYKWWIAYSLPGPLPCLTFPNPNPGCSPAVNAGTLGYGMFCDYWVLCAGSSQIIHYNEFRPMA